MNTKESKLNFGKYKGLQIKEIFQGSLYIKRELIRCYLDEVLNNKRSNIDEFTELNFIDRFDVTDKIIKIIGNIFNEEKPLIESNRVVTSNLEKKISNLISSHWKSTNLGILENIREYAKKNNIVSILGGDPEYLVWCEENIENFELEYCVKKELEQLTINRFNGIVLLYKGNNEYEYREMMEFDNFKF